MNLDDPVLYRCSACGLCQPACPIYRLTGDETDGPRGKMAVAIALANSQIKPEDAASAMARCLLCGRCEKACPAALPLVNIFLACRRAMAAALPLSTAKRLFFRALLSDPKKLDFLQPLAAMSQKLYRPKTFPQAALQPFALPAKQPSARKRALVFPGCLARRVFPNLGQAMAKALEKHGYEPIGISGLPCCGRPQALQGRDITRHVAKILMLLMAEDFHILVTPCPGCLATIKSVWPDLPGLDGHEKKMAARLAAKCADINRLLADNLPGPTGLPKGLSKTVYWHKPCLLEDAAAPLALLESKGNLEIKTASGQCCGAPLGCLHMPGGKSGLQGRLGLEVEIAAKRAGTSAIITACPGCMLALGADHQTAMPVLHSVEVYARGWE